MVAALLKWPQATFASKLEIDQAANKARVTREVGRPTSVKPAVINWLTEHCMHYEDVLYSASFASP